MSSPFSGPGFYGAQVYGIGHNVVDRRRRQRRALQHAGRRARRRGFTVWPAQTPGNQFDGANGGTEYFLSSRRSVFRRRHEHVDPDVDDGQHGIAEHGDTVADARSDDDRRRHSMQCRRWPSRRPAIVRSAECIADTVYHPDTATQRSPGSPATTTRISSATANSTRTTRGCSRCSTLTASCGVRSTQRSTSVGRTAPGSPTT